MAVGIHIVNTMFVGVDSVGNVVDKNSPSTTIRQAMETSHEHRVIPNSTVPNSAGYPRVGDYLELEAGDDYVLNHMDQTTIITYHTT